MTWSHEPAGYDCPFCRLQRGIHDEHSQPGDVVAVTDVAFARISPRWWPDNPGAVLVIPRAHHENLYDLPTAFGHAVWDLTQEVAVAMRAAYPCEAPRPVSTTSRPAARTSGTCTSTSSRGTRTTPSTNVMVSRAGRQPTKGRCTPSG